MGESFSVEKDNMKVDVPIKILINPPTQQTESMQICFKINVPAAVNKLIARRNKILLF